MGQIKAFLFASIVLLTLVATAPSQNQRRQITASDFNIELLNLDVRTHIFSIPEAPARAGYIAHVDLKRIPEWKPSEAVPAETAALRIQFWLEGGVPKIEVTAVLGKIEPHSRPYEWENSSKAIVVTRTLQPDEVVSINETERFGIVPFQVKVFHAQPWSVGPPEIRNLTRALTVLRVSEARPNYILQLRNVSHKAIDGIRWYGTENNRRHGGSGMTATPLIGAGGFFELHQRFEFTEQKRDVGNSIWKSPSRAVVISAILFDDGTFEGEPDQAAELAANMTGDRIQLDRINALFRDVSEASLSDPQQLSKLKGDISGLSEEVNPDVAAELVSRFEKASEDMRKRRIKEEVANGLRATKNNVLHEIEKLEFRLANGNKEDFQRWLNDLKATLGRTRAN